MEEGGEGVGVLVMVMGEESLGWDRGEELKGERGCGRLANPCSDAKSEQMKQIIMLQIHSISGKFLPNIHT